MTAQYLAQFRGKKLQTSELVGTKAEIETWVDQNRAKFAGETVRIWPVIGENENGFLQFGKLLGERVISA